MSTARRLEIYPNKEDATMASKTLIEIYISINDDGDVECGPDAERAVNRLTDSYGGQVIRMIRKAYWVTPPAIQDAGEETIADDEGETTKVEAAE
jgi:hypothetical protein